MDSAGLCFGKDKCFEKCVIYREIIEVRHRPFVDLTNSFAQVADRFRGTRRGK